MAKLPDLKRRRKSVRNTQKITRAMKMVAAAKLRRAQEAIVLARPYARRMQALVNSLARRAELDLHPMLRQPPDIQRVHVVVVTSDRGLCGAFNSNVVNTLLRRLDAELAGRSVEVTAIGRKGAESLHRRAITVRKVYAHILDGSLEDAAELVVEDVLTHFLTDRTDAVYCVYNEFKSAISQRVTLEKLLPFEPARDPDADEAVIDYIYEPSVQTVFEDLLARHMTVQMHRILNESAASEHGARMTAMDAATKNAGEMIDRLTLELNRARQDAITRELIEVVSGAEAL